MAVKAPIRQYLFTDGEAHCVRLAKKNLESNEQLKHGSHEDTKTQFNYCKLSWTDAGELAQAITMSCFC